jgi:hypothetical protein
MVTEQRKYFSNIDYFCFCYRFCHRLAFGGKESPDSIGQCTGE